MLNNLQIIGSRRSGGAEAAFLRISAGLADGEGTTHVALPADSELYPLLDPQLRDHAVAMRGNWDIFSRQAIRKLVAQHDIQIVQTWMGRATRLTGFPMSGPTVHIARLGGYYKPKGFRHAHAWVVNAHGLKQHLLDHGFPAARVFRIPNFVHLSTDVEAVELPVPDDAWVLFAAGRLHPIKGMDTLLDAFTRVPTQIGDRPVHLVIAGDGEQLSELLGAAKQHGAADRVHILGWRHDLPALYKRADAVVFPSREMEGFGNVILEAWAAGKPLLATTSRGANELITHQQDALLSPCEAPVALAENIRTLLSDEQLAASIAANGAEHVARDYSQASVINQYHQLYNDLVRD